MGSREIPSSGDGPAARSRLPFQKGGHGVGHIEEAEEGGEAGAGGIGGSAERVAHKIVEKHQDHGDCVRPGDKPAAEEQSGRGHPQGEGGQRKGEVLRQGGEEAGAGQEEQGEQDGPQGQKGHQAHAQQAGRGQAGEIDLPAGDAEHSLMLQDIQLVDAGAGGGSAPDGKKHPADGQGADGLKEGGRAANLGRQSAGDCQQRYAKQEDQRHPQNGVGSAAQAVELRADEIAHGSPSFTGVPGGRSRTGPAR